MQKKPTQNNHLINLIYDIPELFSEVNINDLFMLAITCTDLWKRLIKPVNINQINIYQIDVDMFNDNNEINKITKFRLIEYFSSINAVNCIDFIKKEFGCANSIYKIALIKGAAKGGNFDLLKDKTSFRKDYGFYTIRRKVISGYKLLYSTAAIYGQLEFIKKVNKLGLRCSLHYRKIMHLAIQYGHLDILKWFHHKKPIVWEVYPYPKKYFLIEAIRGGQLDVFIWAVEQGCPIKYADFDINSYLKIALEHGHSHIIKYLRDKYHEELND